MTKRRATIARRLVEAQHNAAMLTTFNEIDMTAVMGLRERHKEAFKQRAASVSVSRRLRQVSVAALRVPAAQRRDQGDEGVLKRYDIGIARGGRWRWSRCFGCRPDLRS
jgi:2-oxoglutarate dehydrogenase E2 component (dihydrolipoamide succinyltransferase)